MYVNLNSTKNVDVVSLDVFIWVQTYDLAVMC